MSDDAAFVAPPPAPREGGHAPLGRRARIADLDVIRGAALFGVLVCNLAFCFRSPVLTRGGPPPIAAHDVVAHRLILVLLGDKAMTLFSMLFGVGLSIFFEQANARGPGAGRLLARRLFFLALFGLAHAVLLWHGDILMAYALAGYVALFFLRRRPALLVVAVVALTLFPLAGEAWPALRAANDAAYAPDHYEQALRVYGADDYVAMVRYRLYELARYHARSYIFYWPNIVRNMLIGMLVWRSGVLRAPREHARALRWAVVVGLLVGVGYPSGRMAYLWLSHQPFAGPKGLGRLLPQVLTPLLSLAYGAGLLLLLQRGPRWQRWLGALAPLGRMAFTNYLTQTIVFTTLFYGYGFGLIGKVGYAAAASMGVVFYALQGAASARWLGRFEFGPFEWAWRCLTYGRWQPMRRARQGAPYGLTSEATER